MPFRIRLNPLHVVVLCSIVLASKMAGAQADGGPPPRIEAVSLDDFDVSHEIGDVAKHGRWLARRMGSTLRLWDTTVGSRFTTWKTAASFNTKVIPQRCTRLLSRRMAS